MRRPFRVFTLLQWAGIGALVAAALFLAWPHFKNTKIVRMLRDDCVPWKSCEVRFRDYR